MFDEALKRVDDDDDKGYGNQKSGYRRLREVKP
jgi:hypothetical protein